jgi:hypothetical protein
VIRRIVLARKPLGPRTNGRLLKVHAMPAVTQPEHGDSLEHLTLRSLQASQAHLPIFLVGCGIVLLAACGEGPDYWSVRRCRPEEPAVLAQLRFSLVLLLSI